MHYSIDTTISQVEDFIQSGLYKGLVIALSSPINVGNHYVPYNQRYFYVTFFPGKNFQDEIIHKVTKTDDIHYLRKKLWKVAETKLIEFAKDFYGFSGCLEDE